MTEEKKLKIYEIILSGYTKAIEVKADSHRTTGRMLDLYVGDEQVAAYQSVKGWRIVSDAIVEVNVIFDDGEGEEVPES